MDPHNKEPVGDVGVFRAPANPCRHPMAGVISSCKPTFRNESNCLVDQPCAVVSRDGTNRAGAGNKVQNERVEHEEK